MNIDQVLNKLRPNIRRLTPYSSARHEYTGEAQISLDANESPYQSEYNRYPDPNQRQLKSRIAELQNITVDQLMIGNGSDEVLDLIIRIFCIPAKDQIVTLPPTYGMYQVLADINDVAVKEVLLTADFQIDIDAIIGAVTDRTKILFVCSPNNPSGNLLDTDDIKRLLSLDVIVVIDEAYIDFTTQASWSVRLSEYPNLIICQTLSKAKAMAGLRLGYCIAHHEIIAVLNAVKPPYNISSANISAGLVGLQNITAIENQITEIIKQRSDLRSFLESCDFVMKVHPSDANFLLVKVKNAKKVMEYTRQHGVVIRDRSTQPLCGDCVRISIGTAVENNKLIELLKNFKA